MIAANRAPQNNRKPFCNPFGNSVGGKVPFPTAVYATRRLTAQSRHWGSPLSGVVQMGPSSHCARPRQASPGLTRYPLRTILAENARRPDSPRALANGSA
jgi:hypothetical protein